MVDKEKIIQSIVRLLGQIDERKLHDIYNFVLHIMK